MKENEMHTLIRTHTNVHTRTHTCINLDQPGLLVAHVLYFIRHKSLYNTWQLMAH
jgi:hypothetical protein